MAISGGHFSRPLGMWGYWSYSGRQIFEMLIIWKEWCTLGLIRWVRSTPKNDLNEGLEIVLHQLLPNGHQWPIWCVYCIYLLGTYLVFHGPLGTTAQWSNWLIITHKIAQLLGGIALNQQVLKYFSSFAAVKIGKKRLNKWLPALFFCQFLLQWKMKRTLETPNLVSY